MSRSSLWVQALARLGLVWMMFISSAMAAATAPQSPVPQSSAAQNAALLAPGTMVASFQDGLIDALKRTTGKGFAARQTAFAPIVKRSFDSRFMARIAAGSYWAGLTPAQQDELATALENLTIASYAARLKIYKGQKFAVLDEKPAPQDRVLVRAQLTKSSGETVKISYLLGRSEENKAGWAIVDVWFNNTVSELALRRSEFAPVLRDKGIDVLLSELNARVLALSKDEATGVAPMN